MTVIKNDVHNSRAYSRSVALNVPLIKCFCFKKIPSKVYQNRNNN